MASFYGGPNLVTQRAISTALGFTPTLYSLTRDEQNGVLILKAWQQPTTFPVMNPTFAVDLADQALIISAS